MSRYTVEIVYGKRPEYGAGFEESVEAENVEDASELAILRCRTVHHIDLIWTEVYAADARGRRTGPLLFRSSAKNI